TNLSSIFTKTFSGLTAGNYTYHWWSYGNGTSNNYNSSLTYSYNISKAVPAGSASGTSPITYGTVGNVNGTESNEGDGDITYNLYRDNVSVSNPDATTLGAGAYNYIYNATSGQNYTANASLGTFSLTVDQAAASINLTLNNSQNNITITQGDSIDLNCSTLTGDSSAYLAMYREGTLINNGTSPIGNTTTFNTVQVENITCVYQATQNYSISSEIFWVNVMQDITPPEVNLVYPENTSYAINVSELNYTVYDFYLDSCWYVNSSGQNVTITCGNNITNMISAEGSNTWTVWANDTSGNENSSSVTFVKDTIYPSIDDIVNKSITHNSATINWTTNEVTNSTVKYGNSLALSSLSTSSSFVTAHSVQLTRLNAETVYYYNITSCDRVNNCNISAETYNFTTTVSPAPIETEDNNQPILGTGFPTYSTNLEETTEGYQRRIKENWKIRFKINLDKKTETHLLKLDELLEDRVVLTLSSEPQTFYLSVNESKKIDLNNDNYYDLEIFLATIQDNFADLKIDKIHEEKIISNVEEPSISPEPEDEVFPGEKKSLSNLTPVLILVGIIVAELVLISLLIIKHRKSR
ncbi:MAG: hypothetical protein ABH864_00005, partial [archaeon]